jgi:hypothetical protein
MPTILYRLLLTLAGNTLIAVFLTVLGVGGGWSVNLLISQCIGLSIFGTCTLAGWVVAEGPRRVAAVIAAAPVGVAIGLLLGVSLSGVGWQRLFLPAGAQPGPGRRTPASGKPAT